MKTCVNLLLRQAEFLSDWERFQTETVGNIKTNVLSFAIEQYIPVVFINNHKYNIRGYTYIV
jgi:hypothetical protein